MKFSLQGNSLQEELFIPLHNVASVCTFIDVRLKFKKKKRIRETEVVQASNISLQIFISIIATKLCQLEGMLVCNIICLGDAWINLIYFGVLLLEGISK